MNRPLDNTGSPKTPGNRSRAVPEAVDSTPPELAGLARLRSLRVRPERDLTLTRVLTGEQVVLRRLRRANAGLADAWERVAPPDLLGRTALRGVSSGTATIAVPDAGARYELDRWLRSGGESLLIKSCTAPVRKVKIIIEHGNA